MILTQRERGNTCGVGKRKAQDRREKKGEESRRGRRDREPMSHTELSWVVRCHCVLQSMPNFLSETILPLPVPFLQNHEV